MWWAESLKESIAVNENYGLKVLTEQHLALDTAMSQGRYIPFPTFNTEVVPGYYHINIQGSSQMYTGFMHIISDKEVGIVSIVGAGMMSNSGAASKMFEALYNRGINVHLIYTSEIKITVLIKESRVERAVEALKEQFQE